MSSAENEDRIETVLTDSVPGNNNEVIFDRLEQSAYIVDQVIEDMNNWVEVEKVHIYPENKIGMTVRFRWTIERFITTGMEDILEREGYGIAPHLEADWRGRNESEIEYRVRKEIDGTKVFVNLLVEMTSRAFKALNTGRTISVEQKVKREKIEEFLEEQEVAE